MMVQNEGGNGEIIEILGSQRAVIARRLLLSTCKTRKRHMVLSPLPQFVVPPPVLQFNNLPFLHHSKVAHAKKQKKGSSTTQEPPVLQCKFISFWLSTF